MITKYFTDPILYAPTIGCMLMCMAAALVGVLVFVRKRSLLGETLSHAAYPGVILSVMIATFFFPNNEEIFSLSVLIGAFIASLVGLYFIDILEKKFKVKSDAALCFILSAFFGIGITMASRVQMTNPQEYKQMQVFLFGQAATMVDIHIWIYGILSFLIVLILLLFFKEFKTINFDYSFARISGLPTQFLEIISYVLIVLAVVVGMRSVGVVLMSAMLIAPATAARQFTHKLSYMLLFAALFGLLSGFFGNFFSLELALYFSSYFPTHYISLPTGPMIVLVAAFFAFMSLLLAPERGLIIRMIRIALFRQKCALENVLKVFWRRNEPLSFNQVQRVLKLSSPSLHLILYQLKNKALLVQEGSYYFLTQKGLEKAKHIIRLHRLWEVYLANYLGVGSERVHKSAEEMEHIITPDIEEALIKLLKDPLVDPHHQPIPRGQS